MTPPDSLERLAAATVLASFTGPDVPDWLVRRIDAGLGGVCLFGSNLAPGVGAAPVTAALHAARTSLLVTLDEEGGAVTRIEATSGSSVPGNAALGAIDDPGLTRRIGLALGRTLAEAGIDADLAPVADVNTASANPVIGVRSFSADAEVVSRHVAAFVSGMQSVGVAACVKHFPGHGATAVDSHLVLPEVDAPAEVLEQRELAPFRAAVAAGTAMVMSGHLRAPALDSRPATVSHRILTGLLRWKLGFEGAVVTDALDMEGIGGAKAIPATVVEALSAGADLCCLGPDATDDLVGACIDAVLGALRCGSLDEDRLVDAAGRVAGIRAGSEARAAAASSDEPGGPVESLAAVGGEAARRALRIDGALPIPVRGAHVIELRRAVMIAAGHVPWGVVGPLSEIDPTTTADQVHDLVTMGASLQRAWDRPLVIVVRDPQADRDTTALLAAMVGARPDAVVVDMGWPADHISDPPPLHRITTFGPSRASGEAVAQLLTGALLTRGCTHG